MWVCGESEGASAGRLAFPLLVLKQVHVPLGEPGPLGSVLVVGLLRPRAGQAVLGLAGARAQAVQPPAVLGVVDVVLEEKLKEKRRF